MLTCIVLRLLGSGYGSIMTDAERPSLFWQHLQVLGLRENSSYGEPQCILVPLWSMVALDVAVQQNYGVNVLLYCHRVCS